MGVASEPVGEPGADAVPRVGLGRADIAKRTVAVLRGGGWANADVLLVRHDDGLVVVKDYSGGPASRRILGRRLVTRELRAYRRLAGHPAVPRLLGRIDREALAVEHRGGPHLSSRRPWTFGLDFERELAEAVRELHRRGVVHLDLGHRTNVRADMSGRPVLIDFASALVFPTRFPPARVLCALLGRVDWRALKKWRPIFEAARSWQESRTPATRRSATLR